MRRDGRVEMRFETTGRKQVAVQVARFYFVVDIQRGPDTRTGGWPLDIGVPGRLPASDTWDKCPAPQAPWKIAYCTLSRSPVHERGTSVLRCKAGLRFWSHRWNNFDCIIRSLPEDTRVTVRITPWLEDEIFNQAYTVDEIFHDNVDIGIPYGWYVMTWGLTSKYFNSPPLGANSESRPLAFSRPAP